MKMEAASRWRSRSPSREDSCFMPPKGLADGRQQRLSLDDMEQFISSFTEPLSIVWLLALTGCVCAVRRRQWVSALCLAAIALSLSLAGSSVSSRLLASIERPYAQVNLDALPACDAVVVLGGSAGPAEVSPFRFDLNARADRGVTGLELIRRGKATSVVTQNIDGLHLRAGNSPGLVVGNERFDLVAKLTLRHVGIRQTYVINLPFHEIGRASCRERVSVLV